MHNSVPFCSPLVLSPGSLCSSSHSPASTTTPATSSSCIGKSSSAASLKKERVWLELRPSSLLLSSLIASGRAAQQEHGQRERDVDHHDTDNGMFSDGFVLLSVKWSKRVKDVCGHLKKKWVSILFFMSPSTLFFQRTSRLLLLLYMCGVPTRMRLCVCMSCAFLWWWVVE